LGQLSSTFLRKSSVLWPVIQAVICFHSVPEPTAPGIESEPSNRATSLDSSSLAKSWSDLTGIDSILSPLFAEIHEPNEARALA
jgi:hypothetical protein